VTKRVQVTRTEAVQNEPVSCPCCPVVSVRHVFFRHGFHSAGPHMNAAIQTQTYLLRLMRRKIFQNLWRFL
jgi:hypothetical protein